MTVEYNLSNHDVWYLLKKINDNTIVAYIFDITPKGYITLWHNYNIDNCQAEKFIKIMEDNKEALLNKSDDVLGGASVIKLRRKHPIKNIINR